MRQPCHRLFPATLVGLVLAATAPLAAQQRARIGIARYDAPAGWHTTALGDAVTLTSPDGAARVTVHGNRELPGPANAVLATELARAGKHADYRLEAEQAGGKHIRSQGQWCGAVCSYASPARAGQFDYEWITVVGGGGRCVVTSAVFAGKDAYNQLGLAAASIVDGLQLTTTLVVERGKPNLTRFAIDETGDFLEWLLQAPLTDAQRAMIEEEVRGYWRARQRDDMQGIVDLLAARKELGRLPAAERDLAREATLDELLAECRKEPENPMAQMLLGMHAAARQPIAAGEPPLTRQAADAFTEYLFFAAGRLADVTVAPDQAMKDKFAAEVAAGYADMDAATRATIAGMATTWAALRVLWPALERDAQAAWIAAWRRDAALVGLSEQLAALKAAEAAKAAASAKTNAPAGSASKPLTPAAMQAQLAAQQASWRMMQNVMQGNHDTMRIIAGNMGGNTTYQYRW